MFSLVLGFKEDPELVSGQRGNVLYQVLSVFYPPDLKVEDSIPISLWRKLKHRIPEITKLMILSAHIYWAPVPYRLCSRPRTHCGE